MTVRLWKDNQIDFWEFVGMTIALIIATGSITIPFITGVVAMHDGWMAPFYASSVGVITILVVSSLGRRFPGDILPEYAETILGRFGGKFITLLYATYLLSAGGFIIRESNDFLVTGFYPDMPSILFGAMGITLTSYMLWNGIENVGRTTLIVIPIQMALTFIVTAGISSQLQPELIRPYFEHGMVPVIRAAVPVSAWFGELIVLSFFYPLIRNQRGAKAALVGVMVSMIVLVSIGITSAMLFGDEIAQYTYPRESASRFVTVGGFIRIDPFSMAVWLFLTTIKVAIFQYVSSVSIAHLFRLSDHKPLVFPVGALMLALSDGFFLDKQQMDRWFLTGGPVYAATMQVFLPLLLLLVAWLRRFPPQSKPKNLSG